MNYSKIYNNIVTRAKEKNLSDGELHHIVPKSLGGSNTKSNLVRLSFREHYICHRLLVKMHHGKAKQKMAFAFYRLCNRYKLTSSKIYEQTKLQAKQYLSEIHTGKTISEAHKKAITEKLSGENNGMYGKKHKGSSIQTMKTAKLGNTFAKVGIDIVDADGNIINSFESIDLLCKNLDITRCQAEYRIYNNQPWQGLFFKRQKIIKRK